MQRTCGFTLVELMVTIGVAAILVGLAVPSYQNLTRDSYMTTAANDLLVSMQLAHSEAIKRHLAVTVCHSADSYTDDPGCGGDAWQDGWIVYVDATEANPDPNGVVDDGEQILYNARGFGRHRITAIAAQNAAPLEARITFLGSGYPEGDVPGGRNLLLCDDRHSDSAGRVLNISQTGRAQVRKPTDLQLQDLSCEE
jgi:type IV fimbrial biogenesis protein FimT